jgi:hypothetical protein
VLEDFIRTLETRQGEVAELVGVARRMEDGLAALGETARRVLARMDEKPAEPGLPGSPWGANGHHGADPDTRREAKAQADGLPDAILAVLGEWQAGVASGGCEPPVAGDCQLGDCPLPLLYRRLTPWRTGEPGLTVGRFHDVLRGLHGRERIYLHPWTGPRHDIPEPALALLVGHDIAYYASTRKESARAAGERGV